MPDWSLAALVTALMAMRGIDLISATTLLAEIGDLSRFRTPRQLMAYLGLVPSEDSTGERSSAAPSPRPATGGPGACWLSAPGAISIRRGSGKRSRRRSRRRREPCARLPGRRSAGCTARYRALIRKGKLKTVAVIAVARELAAFIWAVARESTTARRGGQS